MHGPINIRQVMFVERNIKAPSCNHCCDGKAISITYSEYVFVALGIQRAMRIRHIIICGLPGFSVFFHIIAWLSRKKKYWTQNASFDLLYKCFVWNIFNSNEKFSKKLPQIYIYKGLHVKYALFLSDFNDTLIFRKIFEKKKPSNIESHKNPSNVSPVVSRGWTDRLTWRS